MTDAFVTYDIDAEDDYAECHRILEEVLKLRPLSKYKELALPESTVMGPALEGFSAAEFRDLIKSLLEASGVHVKRIAVIYAQDWAIQRTEEHELATEARVRRIVAVLDELTQRRLK